MSKILYPVGTQVTLKKYPEAGVFEVIEYKKGEKFPYRLENEFGERGFAGKSKYSVKGLKRYNPKELRSADSVDVSPTQANVDKASPSPSVTEAPRKKCNCISREEVEAMLMSALNDVYYDLGMATQDVNSRVMRLAELADHNFGTVVKKFETLNHDDD